MDSTAPFFHDCESAVKQNNERGGRYAFGVSEARHFVRKNLLDLMAKSPDLNSQAALSRKSEVSIGLINGLINDQPGEASEPRVDIVEKLAEAFGLRAWQLLHPDLDVARREAEFYAKLRELYDATKRRDE